jgi:anaerobic dimethyl sulfoxide reductase subunit B (iron-sulfur subunit)
MSVYGFHFDGTRCTGCKTCVFACKDKNDLGMGTAYRKVYEYTGGQTSVDESGCYATSCFSYNVSVACNHCDDPVCVAVCPTGAMHREVETGLICVDANVCVGCGYCELSCPYGAPKVDRQKGHSVKCDGCVDLVKKGETPVCVMACPARALTFGSIDSLSAQGERASIAPLPAPTYTTPNLFVTPSRDACPQGSTAGAVVNLLEVQ